MLRRAIATALACVALAVSPARAPAAPSLATYGADATATLLHSWFDRGKWRMCSAGGCSVSNQDWGADTLTEVLYLRWKTTRDARLVPYLTRLAATSPHYPKPCRGAGCRQWSDIPEWDALAALREYAATGSAADLTRAEAAYAFVDGSDGYARGACPAIRYQAPFGGANDLKTLETDSNAIRVALGLYDATRARRYLHAAVVRYRAVRRYFRDPSVPLYTAYVFDDGRRCRAVPHRFFASVNGNMILAGLELNQLTGGAAYLRDARATAAAVDRELSDGRGIFANLQADNDVAAPLVEAMWQLAERYRSQPARAWLLRNAQAAATARTRAGNFGRFFDGPVAPGTVTAWQTSGGFALMIVTAQVEPQRPIGASPWRGAARRGIDVRTLPATFRFTGSAVALIGPIGDRCCELGHARVVVDRVETFDRTGIWQNKSSANRRIGRTVLFAWRFASRGRHEIRVLAGDDNAKEGGPYLHVTGEVTR